MMVMKQTKVYDHVVTSTNVVKNQLFRLNAYADIYVTAVKLLISNVQFFTDVSISIARSQQFFKST